MSSRLERVLALDALIRAGRFPNARTIVEQFEVSERTAYETLEFLRDRLNAPVEHDSARGGWYYTEPSYALPAFITTEGELLSFLLSVEVASKYLGHSYEELLSRAIGNLSQSLPNNVQLDLNELATHYSFVAGATARVNPRLLNEIPTAIRDQRPVQVSYYTASRDERSERTLHPYALRNVRGDWHLVAFDSLRDAVRIFALNRIEGWRVLDDQRFSHIDGFSLEEYMSSAFLSERGGEPQEIVIEFDAYQARYIRERPWHATQAPLEELPGGGVILRFTSGALEEIQRWVLGFGSHATVIAPPTLRIAVADESIKMAKKYQAE